MPKNRRNNRPLQQHGAQAVLSDYDTDTANLTDNGPAVPPPPLRTNDELNMMVLRRWCPGIEEIIGIAPFAVLYLYSTETEQWEKCETQGTLFVCQLSSLKPSVPRFRVLILNRKNLENFSLDLVSSEDIQITEEFVIVQVLGENGTPHIYGIWIFSDADTVPDTRETIALTIQQCAQLAEHAEEQAREERTRVMARHAHHPLDEPYEAAGAAVEAENRRLAQLAATQSTSETSGRQIDLETLFRKPQTSHHPPSYPVDSSSEALPAHTTQAPQFSTPFDSDFFRQFSAPPSAQQHHRPVQQPVQHSSQQNALLDLFRTRKHG